MYFDVADPSFSVQSRRVLVSAFSPKLIRELTPRFEDLANELVDGFAQRRRCEFIAEFAEPYAARVLAIMLGIPESAWRTMSAWSSDLGLALSVTIRRDIERVHAALDGLHGYADALIAERMRHPVTTSCHASCSPNATVTGSAGPSCATPSCC